jgi:hypothetical protein
LALPVFEGPLQLLLHLIEARQLDILTVPLAEVADAYVEHLARHPVDAANLSEFVSIAAQLIFLKSSGCCRPSPCRRFPRALTSRTRRSSAAGSSSTAPCATLPASSANATGLHR